MEKEKTKEYTTLQERIAKLEKENTEQKKQLEELQIAYTITVDKSVIREQELEAQVEKMKRCANCEYYHYTNHCKIDNKDINGNCRCDQWKLVD